MSASITKQLLMMGIAFITWASNISIGQDASTLKPEWLEKYWQRGIAAKDSLIFKQINGQVLRQSELEQNAREDFENEFQRRIAEATKKLPDKAGSKAAQARLDKARSKIVAKEREKIQTELSVKLESIARDFSEMLKIQKSDLGVWVVPVLTNVDLYRGEIGTIGIPGLEQTSKGMGVRVLQVMSETSVLLADDNTLVLTGVDTSSIVDGQVLFLDYPVVIDQPTRYTSVTGAQRSAKTLRKLSAKEVLQLKNFVLAKEPITDVKAIGGSIIE